MLPAEKHSRFAPLLLIPGFCTSRFWAVLITTLAAAPTCTGATHPHRFNLGLAARVITSDPQQIDGTHAKRLEEFPAADVFLTTDVPANANGSYTVPVTSMPVASAPAGAAGTGCIGLEWAERRVLTQVWLEFATGSPIVPPAGVIVQYWSSEGRKDSWGDIGQTPWQGKWERLPGEVMRDGDGLRLRIDKQTVPEFRDDTGTLRIRWLLPAGRDPIVVRELGATSLSEWSTTVVRIESDGKAAGPMTIQAYNGEIHDSKMGEPPRAIVWDGAKPRELTVVCSAPGTNKADRTSLRFSSTAGAFAVAVGDLLSTDGVYVKDYGVFVARADGLRLDAYREKFRGAKTVLQRVREMPEQTFERAMDRLWRPVQNNGPTLLSLAADDRKFIVERAGEILFKTNQDRLRLTPRFGYKPAPATRPRRLSPTEMAQVNRKLEGNWLPLPVNTMNDDDMRYSQRTFVVPLDGEAQQSAYACERPLCVAEFTIENTTDRTRPARLQLGINPIGTQTAMEFRPAETHALIVSDGRVYVGVDEAALGPLKLTFQAGTITVTGDLPAKATARCVLYLPGWEASDDFLTGLNRLMEKESGGVASDATSLVGKLRERLEAYWKRMLVGAMQAELPEPLLNDFIRSTQVHCLMASRQNDEGKSVAPLIAPWIAADRYGPLDTEAQAVILGMDLFGHGEFARRSHEFFVSSYNADGLLAKGYTLMGTGQHLWTLAEHYRLTRDDAWLRKLAPQLVRPCEWIDRQRAKTRRLDARGEPLPESGLVPPGVLADWARYAYYLYANAHYEAGVRAVGTLLARLHDPHASRLEQLANEYRDDILRAYRWNQARMPVVPLLDGTWVPPAPSSLYSYGLTRDFFGGLSAIGHDVEVGGNHLIPLGLMDPHGRQADWCIDYMEDRWFLISSIGNAYPSAENERDWFDRGGFAKLQPHYARTSDIHALRDDVKPFVRTYLNTFPVLLNRENLTYWEHMNNGGAWDKTYESGWFLQMTRTMLVMERGRELWLTPFVPGCWMKDGMRVMVRNAPTYFGKVGFEVVSHASGDSVEATLDASALSGVDRLVVRLQHPEGKRILSVTVNGSSHADFDAERQTVQLKPAGGRIIVRVAYQ